VIERQQSGAISRIEKDSLEGREVYKVRIDKKAAHGAVESRTLFVEVGGAILEIREPALLAKITPAARKAVENSIGDGQLVKLESVKLASGVIAAYQVAFKRNGANLELRIAPDGRLAPQ
jgi:hypothetical protein